MRAYVAVLFIALAVPTSAQAPAPNSILVGRVRLSLGAPKDSVLSTLRQYYDVSDMGDRFAIRRRGDATAYEGFLSFRDGRVSSVTRNWNLFLPNTEEALAKSLYGAFHNFGESTRECSVRSFDNEMPDAEPPSEKKGVSVSCGPRTVEVFTNHMEFSERSTDLTVVNETLEER